MFDRLTRWWKGRGRERAGEGWSGVVALTVAPCLDVPIAGTGGVHGGWPHVL